MPRPTSPSALPAASSGNMASRGFQAWCYNRYTLVFQQKLNLVPIFCQIKPCQTNLVFQPTLSNKNLTKNGPILALFFAWKKQTRSWKFPSSIPPDRLVPHEDLPLTLLFGNRHLCHGQTLQKPRDLRHPGFLHREEMPCPNGRNMS